LSRLTLTVGEDQLVKVWDLASGTLLRDLHGHTDFIYSLVFSRDSALLASGQSHTATWHFFTHAHYKYHFSFTYLLLLTLCHVYDFSRHC